MTPDDLAVTIAQRCHGRFTHNEASLVIDALASLGYTFEAPGVPGRYAESDEVRHAMVQYLIKATALPRETIKDVLVAAEQFGCRPREPDQHPSGLRTMACAYENVPRSGAERAFAQKPIDNRMPGMGRNFA
jgi:hypothetical protein